MKTINVEKSWEIDVPLEDAFQVLIDFEKIPENFPDVAESIEVISKEGDTIRAKAIVKFFIVAANRQYLNTVKLINDLFDRTNPEGSCSDQNRKNPLFDL